MKNQAPVVEDTMFGGPTGADCATRALGGDPETPGLVLASSAVDGKQGDAEQFAEVTPETPGGDVATLGDQLDTIELSERFEFPEKVKVFDIKSSSIAVFGSAEVPPLTPVVMWDPTIPEHVRIFFSDFWGHPAEVAGLDAWLLDAASLATDEEEAEIRWAQFDVMISRFMFNWRFRITPGGGLPFIPMQFIIVGRDAIEASVNEEWSSKLHMEHLEEGSHGFLFNRVFRVATFPSASRFGARPTPPSTTTALGCTITSTTTRIGFRCAAAAPGSKTRPFGTLASASRPTTSSSPLSSTPAPAQ